MRCVLAVDDDDAVLEMMSKFLEHRGYSVSRASCAEEALSIIRSRKIDVVIADIVMRGMDGFALSRIIKKEEETKRIKVIILSGYVAQSDAKLVANVSSCDAVLSKPVDFMDLIETINSLTGNGNAEPAE